MKHYIMNPKMMDYRLKEISPALTASMYKEPPVLVSLKSTSTQSKFIKSTSLTTPIMEILQKSKPKSYQNLTSLLGAFRANRSVSQENEASMLRLQLPTSESLRGSSLFPQNNPKGEIPKEWSGKLGNLKRW